MRVQSEAPCEERRQGGAVVESEAMRVREAGVGDERQRLAGLAHRRLVAGARAEHLDDVGRLAAIALADHDVVPFEVPVNDVVQARLLVALRDEGQLGGRRDCVGGGAGLPVAPRILAGQVDVELRHALDGADPQAAARELRDEPLDERRLAAVGPADDAEDDRPAQQAGGPVILGVVGRPNSGKTTLIERLIPEFTRRGLRVGAVKRVTRFDIDVPGKDSWRHGQAGAAAYTVASASKLAFVARRDEEVSLDEIVARYFDGYDVVVCEGYRREAPDVVEVFREAAGYESMVCEPGEPLALVTDAGLAHEHRFGLDDGAALATFLVERLGITAGA